MSRCQCGDPACPGQATEEELEAVKEMAGALQPAMRAEITKAVGVALASVPDLTTKLPVRMYSTAISLVIGRAFGEVFCEAIDTVPIEMTEELRRSFVMSAIEGFLFAVNHAHQTKH